MEDERTARLLRNLERLAAIAQNGLAYGRDPYDIERFTELRQRTAEMMGLISGLEPGAVSGWLDLDQGYATPKVDVRAIVLRGEQVLLVQERSDGLWTPPGGWCDIGASPAEAVVREVAEEAGLAVAAARLLALYDKRRHDHPFQLPHAYKCYFQCTETGGRLGIDNEETADARFFSLDALPPMSLHRSTPRQLARAVALALDPDSAAEFD